MNAREHLPAHFPLFVEMLAARGRGPARSLKSRSSAILGSSVTIAASLDGGESASHDVSPVGGARRRVVLLVEDDAVVRRAVGRVLSSKMTVVEARSFKEGLALLDERPFDVVLSDHDLGLDEFGSDILRRARSVCPRARRVLMSASDEPAGNGDGVWDCFLRKPMNAHELTSALLPEFTAIG